MPVQNLECPNCGAPIDFAGGTTATCPYCSSHLTLNDSGVTAASTLNDLAAGSINLPGVDIDHVRQLVSAGKKIDAIKVVREQTGLGLKEAKDAVEALERGEAPDLTPRSAMPAQGVPGVDVNAIRALLLQNKKIDAIKFYREQTGAGLKEAKDAVEAIEAAGVLPAPGVPEQAMTITAQRPSRTSASNRGCLFGCLPTLLFIGLCAGFVMLTSQIMFRVWGPLDQVMKIVNSDSNVVRVFGQPISPGPFITGKVSSSGSSSSASLSSGLYGPKQNGSMDVSGSWRNGVWNLTIWVTYTNRDGAEQTIRLSQKVP